MNHMALGVVDIHETEKRLIADGWKSDRTTQSRPRRKMATQSLRSRRNPHRIHGVHAQGKALLQRVQRHASRPEMTKRFVLPALTFAMRRRRCGAAQPAGDRSADQLARPKIYSIALRPLQSSRSGKIARLLFQDSGLKSGADSCKGLTEPCFAVNPYQYVQLDANRRERSRIDFSKKLASTITTCRECTPICSAHGFKPGAITAWCEQPAAISRRRIRNTIASPSSNYPAATRKSTVRTRSAIACFTPAGWSTI